MNLPTAEEYLQTIDQRHQGSLASLHNYHFLLEEDGKTYLHKKGNNAIVFKTESQSKLYAIRFFFYQENELFRRYVQLQDYLNNKNLSWAVPFCFLDKEYYPFLKMDWVEGLSFGEYLDTIIHDPSAISDLQSRLVNLSGALEKAGVGHGDLNLDHIRFAKEGPGYVLKLIDYDSMFIPAFKGKDSLRIGTAGFQHPMRLASDFSETTDRFSFWVFLTALEAFKINPSLWIEPRKTDFKKSNRLLFNFSDLAFPEQSSIFNELKYYNKDALDFYVDRLMSFCNKRSADAVELPHLFGERISAQTKKEQAPQKNVRESAAFETGQPPVAASIVTADQKAIKPEVKPAIPKVFNSIKNERIHRPAQQNDKNVSVSSRKAHKGRIISIAVTGLLLIITSYYFIRPKNRSAEAASGFSPVIHENITAPSKKEVPVQPAEIKETPVFTGQAVTNALTQLYQCYDQRNLNAILSNYADNLDDYYDAAAVSKKSLGGIIKSLFIRPYFYQCNPDWQSMNIEKEDSNSCTVTIMLNEKIKTRKRSKQENYTSRIQYIFDKNFKIVSEKRIS